MKRVKRFFGVFAALMIVAMLSVCAFATEGGDGGTQTAATAETVMTSLTTGLTDAQGHMFQGLGSALPIALAVAGVILAVTIGWRIFKRMGKG